MRLTKKSSVSAKLLDPYNVSEFITFDNEKYSRIMEQLRPFPGIKLGRSGAVVGTLSNMPNAVIKAFRGSANPLTKKTSSKCIQINNHFNEIYMNLLITRLPELMKLTIRETKILREHTMQLLDYGASSSGSYIIMPMVGIKGPEGQLLTNLREVFMNNHAPLLRMASSEILLAYDSYISKRIKEYMDCLQLLWRHLNYVNSDTKLTNVFIRKLDKPLRDHDAKVLRDAGFLVDFELLLSDLEKSSIMLNGVHINTYPSSMLKIRAAKLVGKDLIYNIRHDCSDAKFKRVCGGNDRALFDYLMFFIDIGALMIRISPKILDFLPKYMDIVKNIIGETNSGIYKTMLEHEHYVIDKRYGYYLNNIITKFCSKIN